MKNTHNTGECLKWNPDGSPKGGERQVHAQNPFMEQFMTCFTLMQMDNKALLCKMISCCSKKSKHMSDWHSSYGDSASDGSDSEYSY